MVKIDRKTLILVSLAVVMLATAGVLIARYINREPDSPVWHLEYHCANGHQWTAGLGPKPTCPQCGEPAIRTNRFICFKCRRLFVGYETMKLDVGQFKYRMPGSKQWTKEGPETIECPYCKNRANPFDFPKPRLDMDLPVGTVVPDDQTIKKMPGI